MTKKDKLLNKFLTNPQSLKYPEIERILLDLGFKKIQAKGSHIKFRNSLFKLYFTFSVHNNDCYPIYKIEAAKLINNLISDENHNGTI